MERLSPPPGRLTFPLCLALLALMVAACWFYLAWRPEARVAGQTAVEAHTRTVCRAGQEPWTITSCA